MRFGAPRPAAHSEYGVSSSSSLTAERRVAPLTVWAEVLEPHGQDGHSLAFIPRSHENEPYTASSSTKSSQMPLEGQSLEHLGAAPCRACW